MSTAGEIGTHEIIPEASDKAMFDLGYAVTMALHNKLRSETTNAPGQEQYEYWKDFRGKKWCQYDYRHTDSELFSCNCKTLGECRRRRNNWLKSREG